MEACTNLTDSLLKCIRESDCMTKDKKTFHECHKLMRDHDPSINTDCYAVRNALYVCRKSQLDQRLRFRGRNRDTLPEDYIRPAEN